MKSISRKFREIGFTKKILKNCVFFHDFDHYDVASQPPVFWLPGRNSIAPTLVPTSSQHYCSSTPRSWMYSLTENPWWLNFGFHQNGGGLARLLCLVPLDIMTTTTEHNTKVWPINCTLVWRKIDLIEMSGLNASIYYNYLPYCSNELH